MVINAIWDDLAEIVSHIYLHPEEVVKRWTSIECEDFQLPLIAILGFLESVVPPLSDKHKEIRNDSVYRVIREIVSNSHLDDLLECDDALRRFRYRNHVSDSTKAQVAKFIAERSGPPLLN